MITTITTDHSMTELTSASQRSIASQARSDANVIAMEVERCKCLQAALQRLRMRSNKIGQPVDAERIRNAFTHEQSLQELFAADPGSLAANSADAQLLAQYLKRSGLDVESQLRYPVLVRSTVDGKSTERLVWMSLSERTQLDQLPLSPSVELPGCPTRSETGKHGDVTVYCCLDVYATLRVPGAGLPEVCALAESALQSAGSELRSMVGALGQAMSKRGTGLEALRGLLKDLCGKLERHLDDLHDEHRMVFLEYQQWQKDLQKRRDEKAQERKRAVESLHKHGGAGRAFR